MVGVRDGKEDGDEVGIWDGSLVVGSLLGEKVGFDDTPGDGFIDGDIVGIDGLLVGLKDGPNVGWGDGSLDGKTVGTDVGSSDGGLVGVIEGFVVG